MRVLPQRATLPPTPAMAASVRWTLSTTLRPRPGWISPVSRSRASCWRAISPTAIERRTSRDSVEPSSASWVAVRLTAASRSRASARSRRPADQDGAGGVDEVGLDVEPPPVRRAPAPVLGLGGVVAGQGLLDEPADLGPRARPGRRRERPVDLGGRRHRQAAGLLGHAHRPPHRQPPGHHLLPEPRQPVAQLQGLADVGLAGVGGHAQRCGVLHQRELRDQRSTRAGDRQRAVAERADLVGGPLAVGFDGVLDRPLDGELESLDLEVGGGVAVGAQRTEEGLGGGLRCFGHGSIAAPATDSQAPKSGLSTGVGENSLVKTFPLNRRGSVTEPVERCSVGEGVPVFEDECGSARRPRPGPTVAKPGA